MRVLVQRVARSEVRVRGEVVASGGAGFLVLVGVGLGDGPDQARKLAAKLYHLRVFEDQGGKMNLALPDVGGEVVVVPQFTLYGDTSAGRRPSWVKAAPPDRAEEMVEAFASALEALGAVVHRSAFREHMEVQLVNDGPVTLLLEA
ncbi:MAG TPA: D-aminoacyl-tRNA deacylase [Actinomycetota bacterium]